MKSAHIRVAGLACSLAITGSLAIAATSAPAAFGSAGGAKCGVKLDAITPTGVPVKGTGTKGRPTEIFLPLFSGTVMGGKGCADEVSGATMVQLPGLSPESRHVATASRGKAKKHFEQYSIDATGGGVRFSFKVCSISRGEKKCQVTPLHVPSKKASFLPAPRL